MQEEEEDEDEEEEDEARLLGMIGEVSAPRKARFAGQQHDRSAGSRVEDERGKRGLPFSLSFLSYAGVSSKKVTIKEGKKTKNEMRRDKYTVRIFLNDKTIKMW